MIPVVASLRKKKLQTPLHNTTLSVSFLSYSIVLHFFILAATGQTGNYVFVTKLHCNTSFFKDTSCMFLLHRRLGGVDGFADAAQLEGEDERREVVLHLGQLTHPLTRPRFRACNTPIANSWVMKRYKYRAWVKEKTKRRWEMTRDAMTRHCVHTAVDTWTLPLAQFWNWQ